MARARPRTTSRAGWARRHCSRSTLGGTARAVRDHFLRAILASEGFALRTCDCLACADVFAGRLARADARSGLLVRAGAVGGGPGRADLTFPAGLPASV